MKKGVAVVLCTMLLFALCLPAAGEGVRVVRVGWIPCTGVCEEQDGRYSGYVYDYLTELAALTGWRYEFVAGNESETLERLENGELDLAGGLAYTKERALRLDFTELPVGYRYTTLFAAGDRQRNAYDFAALDGMRVGALRTDAVAPERLAAFAQSCGFTYTIVPFDSAEALAAAVSRGDVDAGLTDAFAAPQGFGALATFAPEPFYFAVGSTDMLVPLNRAMWQLQERSPELERELSVKRLNTPSINSLTERELALVEETRQVPLTVGVIASSAPACYWDEKSGAFEGIFIELMRAVSEKTGLQFDFVPIDLSVGMPVAQLKQGAPDLVLGIIHTANFDEDPSLSLSDALLHDSLVVVGRKGEDFMKDPSNRTIAYMKGFQVAGEYAAEVFPRHRFITFDTAEECLAAVESGKADATIYTRTCVSYLLHDPHYEQLELIPAYYRDVDTCAAGLSGTRSDTIALINKGLAMISEPERNEIIMNTTQLNPYRITLSDTLYKYRIPLCVIAFLFLAIIAVLLLLNATKQHSRHKLQIAFENEQQAHRQEKAALVLAEQASAAKGSFMSRMSHEIRTPLNAVIGYNTIARNELSEARTDTEHRQAEMRVMDCLTKSDIASRHLLTIINDVLDMSAIESGRMQLSSEMFDFQMMLKALTSVFYTQARSKGVRLEVVPDALTDEWLVGDRLRVSQVLTNLLSNAVKFTPEGGSVRLVVHAAPSDDALDVTFTVADTGIGMTKAYLERIWTPFEQADSSISRRFGGTGLGLSITKSLVDLMGGDIAVESEPDKGTTFTVTLRFGRTEQPAERACRDYHSVKALVVDDDASTCDYMRLLLLRCGARPESVTDGAAAVERVLAAKRADDPFSVCLIDWRMPHMDGLETARRIREVVGSELPIAVLTAYDYTEIMPQATAIGVQRFLAKPVFESTLTELLAAILGEQAPTPPQKAVAYDFSGLRVLLAEDNRMNREVGQRILAHVGFTVDGAWDGQAAVERFQAEPSGTYQAVLMDIHMPIMNGHDATRAIRACGHPDAATVPIIAMTADAFAENVSEALAAGMTDHIAKPIDAPTLYELLRRYVKSPRAESGEGEEASAAEGAGVNA